MNISQLCVIEFVTTKTTQSKDSDKLYF